MTATDHLTHSPLVRAALDHAATHLAGDTTGHDIHHVHRVLRTAVRLAEIEGADVETVALVAALHDIADFKFTGDEHSGADAARTWLLDYGADALLAERVALDIAAISFKGAHTRTLSLSLEGKCVQDADRLDALGPIGIARCFAWGGRIGRSIHDPAVPVAEHRTVQEYLDHIGTSINHFHEKLLLLPERMHTDTAKAAAAPLVEYMLRFLDGFETQWESTLPAPRAPR